MTILRAPDSDAAPPPPPPPPPAGPPVFPIYYLWWNGNPVSSPSSNWRHLGPNYPYTASPSPLPARIGVDPDFDSPTADESVIASLYADNSLLDVSDGFAYRQELAGVVEKDCDDAYNLGCAGFFVNWAGISLPDTSRLNRVVAKADAMVGQGKDFRVIMDWKGEGGRPTQTVIDDMQWYLDTHGSKQCMYRINDKPVIRWSATFDYTAQQWADVSAVIRPQAHFIAGQPYHSFPNAAGGANIGQYFDGNSHYWSTQDPYNNAASFSQLKTHADYLHSVGKTWVCPWTVGYDARLLNGMGTTFIPRKDGETMQRIYNGNKPTNPDVWMVISWNEIAEGSYIVALERHGTRYQTKLAEMIAAMA